MFLNQQYWASWLLPLKMFKPQYFNTRESSASAPKGSRFITGNNTHQGSAHKEINTSPDPVRNPPVSMHHKEAL